MKSFNKILIANRGEIAVRIIRSAKEMGIKTVAIYSQADAESLHVRMADESYSLGDNELSSTYLNIDKIILIAKKSGSEAIHPGYGFLAENPELVAACMQEGIVFIGPSATSIHLMGNKIEARNIVRKLGIPMTQGAVGTLDEIIEKSATIPLPLLVKAAAGGGGKGMRIVREREKLKESIEATSREAKNYFGDGQVYVEQYIEEPRHIEIQVLGDKFGTVIHLFERECSIQRRYQKIIEESPSPTLTAEVREKMGRAAAAIAANIGYDSAGTIEFLVDKNLDFYFLEMNTRIQVEHPVTEMVTGIDIVKEQILIAAGNPLGILQENVVQIGHAIEARIYAEDPDADFMPAPGKMYLYHEPKGVNIRVDSYLDGPSTIHSFYDPMISKLITWGHDREAARIKLIDSLEHFVVQGLKTNISFLYHLLKYQDFILNKISTKYCDEHAKNIIDLMHDQAYEIDKFIVTASFLIHHFETNRNEIQSKNIWNEIGYWRINPIIEIKLQDEIINLKLESTSEKIYNFSIGSTNKTFKIISLSHQHIDIEVDGLIYNFYISTDEHTTHWISTSAITLKIKRVNELYKDEFYVSEDAGGEDAIRSPMPGKVIKLLVEPGQQVKKGDVLVIVEAMKMENNIEAHREATVEDVFVNENEMVENSKVLMKLKPVEKTENK